MSKDSHRPRSFKSTPHPGSDDARPTKRPADVSIADSGDPAAAGPLGGFGSAGSPPPTGDPPHTGIAATTERGTSSGAAGIGTGHFGPTPGPVDADLDAAGGGATGPGHSEMNFSGANTGGRVNEPGTGGITTIDTRASSGPGDAPETAPGATKGKASRKRPK